MLEGLWGFGALAEFRTRQPANPGWGQLGARHKKGG